MVDGRAKGNKYENRVCRILSSWLVPGDWASCRVAELPLRRRSTSILPLEGHWHGKGDILHKPFVDDPPFAFECKHQEKWDLDGMLANARWPVWGWWQQAKDQAMSASLRPLLLFTRNLRKDYALMEEDVFSCLEPRPRHGPAVTLQRPSGERLALLLLDDLVGVPRARVKRLRS